MGKINIMYIELGFLVLLTVINLVDLVSRVKKAGKGNWTFRVSWKGVVAIGVRYLLLLAWIWFVAYMVFDTFHEAVIGLKSIEFKYWLLYIVVMLVGMINFIDISIVTKEVEEEAEEKNP